MGRVRIVTDSTADIPKEWAAELEITVVPALLFFGKEKHRDGELTLGELFRRMDESGVIPTTSQPAAGAFMEVYEELTKEGDSVLSIHLTSKLSGLYSTACLGRNLLSSPERERVVVIDSLKTTMALGLIVIEAAKAAGRGEGLDAITSLVEKYIRRANVILILRTLDYLKMGGRIGKAEWILGSILSVKPILSFSEDGWLVPLERVKTWRKGQKRLVELVTELVPFEQIVVMHARDLPEAERTARTLSERLGVSDIPIMETGSVLAVHAGPGGIGVCFLRSEK